MDGVNSVGIRIDWMDRTIQMIYWDRECLVSKGSQLENTDQRARGIFAGIKES